MDINKKQEAVCKTFGSSFVMSPIDLKIGIADNVQEGKLPINGLRHPLEGDTTGWYIWAGEEFSNDADFFKPMHVEHFYSLYPHVAKYLGLAPGWRFLIADDYEDVWEDVSLLI